jgi:hypothetical protein
MRMYAKIDDILRSAEQPFSIIEEFATLSPKRKVLLCDHLFSQSRSVFQKTVKLLWPEAQIKDMRKLERFLMILKNTAH